ncbi:group II intron maturase-specific domain-containing protein [Nocardia amamiensis]|uniref:group II intron maturase-specific domain-containing protein n=1 Tax=Nocardia amamiensis TaxID=404578 RepID=UPI000A905857|nr:group II intron maturase-specific domain-containing protein [Nocardia amamiensis]
MWDTRAHGVLVRFADDAVVICRSRQQAEAALARLMALLADLGLEPKAAKTRIVHLTEGGEGLDFLGFHHRWVRAEGRAGGKGVAFLARWPADKAMQHARNRIRDVTGRRRTRLRVEAIMEEVNRFLRGWAGYFRYWNSSARFEKIGSYALMRIAGFLAKKHKRTRGFGRWVIAYASDAQLGLIRLDGTVVAPRPFRAWWVTPNAGGERRR